MQKISPAYSLFPYLRQPIIKCWLSRTRCKAWHFKRKVMMFGLHQMELHVLGLLVLYRRLVGHQQIDPAFQYLWKSPYHPKHKVSFQLLLKDRLTTRNILRRKHMVLPSYDCTICFPGMDESVEHLFWICPFAKQCWEASKAQHHFRRQLFDNVQALKIQLNCQFFMVAIIIMCWHKMKSSSITTS